MNASVSSTRRSTLSAPRRRRATTGCAWVLLHLFPVVLAAGAQAQTGACEQLKGVLAARIDPSIRGYSLEDVPAGTPVPAGAKVIGTCEAGARKILFRRWGGAQGSSAAASAAPSSAAAQADAPVSLARRATPARVDRVPEPAAVPVPVPAPASSPALRQAARSGETALPAAALPLAESSHPRRAGGDITTIAAPVEPVVPQPPPAPRAEAAVPESSLAQQVFQFLVRHWPWALALAVVPLAASLWAWVVYRRSYDEAGLPRGPRLS